LKGREPRGIVAPSDYERVRSELIEKFRAEKIPGTNDPAFIEVLKGEELYARKQELNLPDLIVVPAPGYYPRKKFSRRPAVRTHPRAKGGVHRTGGVYAFEGTGIVPSNGTGQPHSIADIAPTLLAALGQPIPKSMTGKVIQEIFASPLELHIAEDGGGAAKAES